MATIGKVFSKSCAVATFRKASVLRTRAIPPHFQLCFIKSISTSKETKEALTVKEKVSEFERDVEKFKDISKPEEVALS